MNEPLVYPNVEIGEGTVIEPGAVVGVPPRGAGPGELPTRIGPGGHIRSGTVIYGGATIGARVNTLPLAPERVLQAAARKVP